MAKKTNTKLIGAFVVGAIALTIVGILGFGGGEFLKTKGKFVAFFHGSSLSGLDVGSPVTFRGVKVGSVTSVVIMYDIATQTMSIPVHLELDPEKFQIVSGERNPTKNIEALIAKGLRGQLQSVSLVTGQTAIDFGFYPDTPIRLSHTETGVMELPTIPSDIDILKANVTGLLAKISKLPLEEMSNEIIKTIKDADQMLGDADGVVKGAGGLVGNVDAQVKPLTASVMGASDHASSLLTEAEARLALKPGEPLQNLNQVLVDAQKLVNNTKASWPQIATAAVLALKTVGGTLAQTDALLKTAQNVISPSSPMDFELVSTLREFKNAATALKVLAEYFQRNPSALLTGNR